MGALIFIILLALYLYGITVVQAKSNVEKSDEEKCPPHSWYFNEDSKVLTCRKCTYRAGGE